jgi:hypothetical protein
VANALAGWESAISLRETQLTTLNHRLPDVRSAPEVRLGTLKKSRGDETAEAFARTELRAGKLTKYPGSRRGTQSGIIEMRPISRKETNWLSHRALDGRSSVFSEN